MHECMSPSARLHRKEKPAWEEQDAFQNALVGMEMSWLLRSPISFEPSDPISISTDGTKFPPQTPQESHVAPL